MLLCRRAQGGGAPPLGDFDIATRLAVWPALARAASIALAVGLLAGCSRGLHAPPAATAPVAEASSAPSLDGGPAASDLPASSALAEVPASSAEPARASEPAQTASEDAPAPIPDPLQPINRQLFKADRAAAAFVTEKTPLKALARPPQGGRASLSNVLRNIGEPRSAANHLLQRRPANAVRTAARFVINSTVGLGGLFDVARKLGLKRADTDFGRTLASYGVRAGAYLYLPVAGPTSVRDVVGMAVDGYFFPFHWLGLGALPQRALSATTTSLARLQARPSAASPPVPPGQDAYAVVRAAYQAREHAAAPTTALRARTPEPAAQPAPAVVVAASR